MSDEVLAPPEPDWERLTTTTWKVDTTDRDLLLALVAAQDEVEAAWREFTRPETDYAACRLRIDSAEDALEAARAAVTRWGHELMKEAQGE